MLCFIHLIKNQITFKLKTFIKCLYYHFLFTVKFTKYFYTFLGIHRIIDLTKFQFFLHRHNFFMYV